jgi:energy-coupling factor transport system ATP-binding protein
MPSLVDIAGLRFAYGDGREALRGIDLAVADGEHVIVVGPNGSGKSTLARIIAGLEAPGDADRALVCGHELREPGQRRAARRQAGILFQDPESQVVGATVEQDVAFGLENLGLPAAEIAARVDEMLVRFGLQPLREREPHLLSGGQKQRTALAGVLAVPRRVIVLDEPTAMLDTQGRLEVRDAVRLLADQGLALIAVTQEMAEVPGAGRVIALEEGRVVFDGPPADLFGNAGLLGRLSLGVPVAADVALELRSRGVAIPDLPFTAEALAKQVGEVDVPLTPARPRGHAGSSIADMSPELSRSDEGPGLALRCDGLSFSYGGVASTPALADVSFRLPAGSATALLGPSGSGKSTLLLLLRGLLAGDAGEVILDDTASGSRAYAALQRRVGVVFQQAEVQLFATTVADDVAFGPRQLGWAEAEVDAAVDESLAAVGLPRAEHGGRHPYSLSGGEQRRAALAGVLAMRPGLLLLDEPFVSLDPGGRRDLAAALAGLKAAGVTLVLATHDIDEAWALCDERLLLLNGRLLAAGPWRFDEPGRQALTDAGLPLPTLVDLWRRLGLPADQAPTSPVRAAEVLAEAMARPAREAGE